MRSSKMTNAVGKVYFTSRKTKAGFLTYKLEKGWVYKYRGKESKIYEYRKDAEYAMMLEILSKKNTS